MTVCPPSVLLHHLLCSSGVPHFTQEPQDVSTFPNTPFNLSCAAVGPPEPVEVLWWLGGFQEGESGPSPSILRVPGQTTIYICPGGISIVVVLMIFQSFKLFKLMV